MMKLVLFMMKSTAINYETKYFKVCSKKFIFKNLLRLALCARLFFYIYLNYGINQATGHFNSKLRGANKKPIFDSIFQSRYFYGRMVFSFGRAGFDFPVFYNY